MVHYSVMQVLRKGGQSICIMNLPVIVEDTDLHLSVLVMGGSSDVTVVFVNGVMSLSFPSIVFAPEFCHSSFYLSSASPFSSPRPLFS